MLKVGLTRYPVTGGTNPKIRLPVAVLCLRSSFPSSLRSLPNPTSPETESSGKTGKTTRGKR
jgi:hypothetical protein